MATPKRQTRKKEKSRIPVYFLSLTVENVRCFGERQTLDLSDGRGRPAQWTIILGENGVGKTTLLQCCAVHLPAPPVLTLLRMEEYIPPYLRMLMSKKNKTKDIFISVGFQIGKKLTENEGLEERVEYSITQNEKWFTGAEDRTICFGYGASRRTGETSLSDVDDYDSTASLFSEDVALLNAEEWLLQADYAAKNPSSIRERAKKQRDQIKEILLSLLPDVSDIKIETIKDIENRIQAQVQVKTPYGWVLIRDLSLGYKTLIAWMVDFASRMFAKYPASPNPLFEPAVVLVDEIDLHLHPKWQRLLMDYLSEKFPNTQFIATAHSPLVVQAATDANIVLLRREGDHVVIENDPQTIKGWRVDQILTSELFGLESARPPQYDTVIAEREKILSKSKLTKKDKERLHELAAKISEFPTGETSLEIEAMDIVRRAAQRLKKEDHPIHDSNQ